MTKMKLFSKKAKKDKKMNKENEGMGVKAAQNEELEVIVEEEVKEEEKTVTKKEKNPYDLNAADYALMYTFYGLVRASDFICDDIVKGKLPAKIKDRLAKSKGRKLFAKQGWAPVTDDSAVVEVVDVPAVIEVTEAELKTPEFTITEEASEVAVNNAKLNDIIKRYNYTDKILATAILFCTGKIDDKQVGAVVSSTENSDTDENIEFVNSVCLFFTGKRFAEGAQFKEKEFNVSTESLEMVIRDLSNLDIMQNNDIMSDIIVKSRDYIKTKSDKIAVIFDNSKLDLFVSNCPKEIISKVERFYGEIIKDYDHKIQRLSNGMVQLYLIRSESVTDVYTIDPGIIFGGEYKVMVTDEAGNDYFTSNIPIIRKYFMNSAYRLTQNEVTSILVDEKQFTNQNLILNYDFANINMKLKDISNDQMMALQAKLYYIRAEIIDRYLVSPRMRIKNFKDENSFIIVSDNKCVSPLDEMAKDILSGLVIKVKNNTYIIEFVDENGNKKSSDKLEMDLNLAISFLYGQSNLNDIRKANAVVSTSNVIMNNNK